MSSHKHRIKMKTFIASQFGYCALVWRFHNRELNSQINKLHERASRKIYKDYTSSFTELYDKDSQTVLKIMLLPLL